MPDHHDPLTAVLRGLEAERFGTVVRDYQPTPAERAAARARVRLLEETAYADAAELHRLHALPGGAA